MEIKGLTIEDINNIFLNLDSSFLCVFFKRLS